MSGISSMNLAITVNYIFMRTSLLLAVRICATWLSQGKRGSTAWMQNWRHGENFATLLLTLIVVVIPILTGALTAEQWCGGTLVRVCCASRGAGR